MHEAMKPAVVVRHSRETGSEDKNRKVPERFIEQSSGTSKRNKDSGKLVRNRSA